MKLITRFIPILVLALSITLINSDNTFAATCYGVNGSNEVLSGNCPPEQSQLDGCYFIPNLFLPTPGAVSEIDCDAAENGEIVFASEGTSSSDPFPEEPVPLEENPILVWLVDILNFLSYGIGIVVVGAIIVSGIQYTVSQGNPQKTAAARDRIVSSLIALVLYGLLFVILQWLIPGGVFN